VTRDVRDLLEGRPSRTWLITGAAGFIGSNLVEALLAYGQRVIGLDNFSTGHRHNLEDVRLSVGDSAWSRFDFVEGDIRDPVTCARVTRDVDVVLHQAALGSVPRSIEDPIRSFESNVSGFARLIVAAKEAGVRRFVYASSSSVYGDHPALPKVEHTVGRVLSPYAATKAADEVFAQGCAHVYGMECIGLRYFNVFGPRQDPDGAYAAVIPTWIASLLRGETVWLNGDGETSRDFCYIANVIQANILAGTVSGLPSPHEVFNVAVGHRTTLMELYGAIVRSLRSRIDRQLPERPTFRDFRAGDVRHSLADISKATELLGYEPTHQVEAGLELAMAWYLQTVSPEKIPAP
jgi:UDP-N-acetylglucosamine 4-epimerase